MKRNGLSLLAVLTLGSLVALAPTSHAEDAPSKPEAKHGPRPGGPGGPGPGMMKERLNKMSEELKLTDDQKTKVEAIMKDQGEKMRSLWNDASVSQEDKRAKMNKPSEAGSTKIKAVLTPEQQTKFETMQKENQERMKKQREGHKDGAPKKDDSK
jgi:periplasmic protein CpxP/Spy